MSVRIAFSSLGAMLGYMLSMVSHLSYKVPIAVFLHIGALALFVVKEIRNYNLRTDFADEADAEIRVNPYDSASVTAAVMKDEGKRTKKPVF